MKITLSRLFWRWLPKKKISRWAGNFAKHPASRRLIPWYIKRFNIDLTPVKRPVHDFENLMEFFIRELNPDARPIDPDPRIVVSPVDGTISQSGKILEGTLIQAKGVTYSLEHLLGKQDQIHRFTGGQYITIYLSPRDYHRIHMPVSGTIREVTYIPGELYPVNETGVHLIPGLFAENERVISYISTDFGVVALIKIGATNVGSIKLVFDEEVKTNPHREKPQEHKRYEKSVSLEKGDELGRFEFGSTVILLFEPDQIDWTIDVKPGTKVQMGQSLARILKT
ncbi:archaetidylserine decarboxylase [Paenactinomyces guangxiensis]|uniref:Phosphatidylserine decarboxylase proenzyme n=1 Tax=Paenactinomyces guangxiensis TaxID=1490290 RepID=A0A7W1WN20_9BACL|nr:archaetidylserine decarboxylase [Paenactinomyces guangxiensis]MBA4492942.1 phosphatidylserine decarboxylase [Paenactinomyces guangxiensis]MBH8590209.1 phosphatidylserine decarboxylase [Paenactinomyces guangxiensis]